MAFDFGAALTAAGQIAPAAQEAQENQRQIARQQVLDKLKERELQQWVPVRSYSGTDGSKHTVYLTPQGYQDKVEEPSTAQQLQSKVDAFRSVYKGDWTPEVQKEVIEQLAGIKPQNPYAGISVTTDKDGNAVFVTKPNAANPQGSTAPVPGTTPGTTLQKTPPKPAGLDWVDQYDAQTKQWFKVGYDKTNHQKVTSLPETKVGFGITPMETMTWNPMVGEWVRSYRMPAPGDSFGGQTGQPQTPSGMPGGTPPPPSTPSPSATINKLANPSASAPSSAPNSPPPISRYPSMGSQFRTTFDTISALQQQFVGQGNDPLWNYSWMMDNKPLAAAINNALTASMQVMPTGSDNPGLGEGLARVTGLTGLVQSKVSENIRKSRDEVQKLGGDQALQLVDRLAELKGSIPAMRTYSKASAAQGSIAALIQESPVLNTSSSRDFTLRVAYTMRTLAAAMAADPSINPLYSRWFYTQANAAEQSGKKASPQSSSAPKTAEQYLSGVQ